MCYTLAMNAVPTGSHMIILSSLSLLLLKGLCSSPRQSTAIETGIFSSASRASTLLLLHISLCCDCLSGGREWQYPHI